MKKFLVALFALAVAVSVATAGVGIGWGTAWGVYTSDSPNVNDGPGAKYILDNYSVIWQLIYAGANNAIEPPNAANVAGQYVATANPAIPGHIAYADDVVWASRTLAQIVTPGGTSTAADGTEWNNYLGKVSGNTLYEDLSWNTAGFVYQRIFEGTPVNGSWFYNSPLQALDLLYTGPPGTPGTFNVDAPGDVAGIQPNRVIPEPATMSLLGLGALALVLRRRRS